MALASNPPGECPALEATVEPPRALALLVGYPEVPAELRGEGLTRLDGVDDDVLAMLSFFGSMGAVEVRVLLRVDSTTRRAWARTDFQAPTARALGAAVDALATTARQGPRSEIYVFFAGHGRKGARDGMSTSELFLEPDPDSDDEVAASGILDGHALEERVLAPLSAVGNVHLIVDACQSYYLLEARGVERKSRASKTRPPVEEALASRFAATHPGVGALLATNGSQNTYESPEIGGLFSYAVRSAAMGAADRDLDGRITYGEMSSALRAILARRAGTVEPGVVAPRLDSSATFVDLRATGAARLCFTPEIPGRYTFLRGDGGRQGLIHTSTAAPAHFFLGPGETYLMERRVTPGERAQLARFVARTGAVASMTTEILDLSARGEFAGELFPRPLTSETFVDEVRDAPRTDARYTALAVALLLRAGERSTLESDVVEPGAWLAVQHGWDAWQLGLSMEWSRWAGRVGEQTATEVLPGRGQDFTAQTLGGALSGRRVVVEARVELVAWASAGADVVFQSVADGRSFTAARIRGELGLDLVVPWWSQAPWAVLVSAGGRASLWPSTGEVVPEARVAVGIEWEVAQ